MCFLLICTNGVIDFIQTEEGIARRNGNSYSYEYNLADHLGNVRATFYHNPVTNQLEVLQRDDYYAFGLRKDPVVKPGTNNYLYNGKELQQELGVGSIPGDGQYDYGARFYDPTIGRWNVIDGLADAYYEHSPYGFVANNPVKYVDPDGNIIVDANGNIVVTTTGKQITAAPIQTSNSVKNDDGTQSATFLIRTYNIVNIFADNGTPVEAMKIAVATQVNATFDKDGDLLSSTSTNVDQAKFDVVSDCHGYTFGNDKIWINNDQVSKILENDGYTRNVDEKDASAVIFRDQNGNVIHSSGRNSDGSYTSNAGITKTQYNISLSKACGSFYTGEKGNTEFVKKKNSNKTIDTKLGTVENGIRTISDTEEIKKFLMQFKE